MNPLPSNKSLHRSGIDKVLGHGRPRHVLHSLSCVRVLKDLPTAAELSRYAASPPKCAGGIA